MIRPDETTIRAVAGAVFNYPDLLKWVNDWRVHELEQLPNVINNPALAQGRCQVLQELYRFLSEAPKHAAKS